MQAVNVYDYHRDYIAVPRVGQAVRVGFLSGGTFRSVVTGVIRRVTHDVISIDTGNGTAEFDRHSRFLAHFPNAVVEEERAAA